MVMVVVAVALGVVAARMSGLYTRSQIDNTAATTLAMMDQCRSRAINEGTTYRLAIDPEKRRAWTEQLTPYGYRPAVTGDASYVTWEPKQTLEVDSPLVGGIWYIAFDPDGSSDQAHIVIEQAGQTPRQITSPSPAEPFRIVVADRPEPGPETEGGFDVPDVY